MRQRTIGNRAFDVVHAVMALASSNQLASACRLARRLEADAMLRARSGTEELELGRDRSVRPSSHSAAATMTAPSRRFRRCGPRLIAAAAALRSATSFISLFSRRRCARSGGLLPVRLAAERALRKPASGLQSMAQCTGVDRWERPLGDVSLEFTGAQATNETKKPLR